MSETAARKTEGIPLFVCEGVAFACWTLPDGSFEWRSLDGRLVVSRAGYASEQDPRAAPGETHLAPKYAARVGERQAGGNFGTIRSAMIAAVAASKRKAA